MNTGYIDELKRLLESKGIRPSYQRLKILHYLATTKEHPSVLMVHEAIKKEIPTLSRTTIYNTLAAFAEKGLVLPLPLSSEEMRYDGTTTNHHHFVCKECGRIYDIEVNCPYGSAKAIQGHQIQEIHGHFRGVCSDCRTQGRSRPIIREEK